MSCDTTISTDTDISESDDSTTGYPTPTESVSISQYAHSIRLIDQLNVVQIADVLEPGTLKRKHREEDLDDVNSFTLAKPDPPYLHSL